MSFVKFSSAHTASGSAKPDDAPKVGPVAQPIPAPAEVVPASKS